MQARPRARGVRRQAGREAVRPGLHRQVADGDRLRALDGAPRRLEDGHRGQARRAPGDLDDQGVAAQMHQDVLDRAMQVHGALGMSDDTPLAAMWRQGRWLRIADGPDEVHKMVIALRELNSSSRARRGGLEARHGSGNRTIGLRADRRAEGLRRGHPRLRRAREVRDARGRPPLRRGGRQDGRAGLVRAADRRAVRRLGRQLPGRLPVPRGDRARPDPDRRLRRDADRGRRAEPVRHRGAEAEHLRARDQGRRRWRSRCPSPTRAPTWPR